MYTSQVNQLEFYPGLTNGRIPVSKLSCMGEGCTKWTARHALCKNLNYGKEPTIWECTLTNLPPTVKLGKTEVTCEGYKDDNDVAKIFGSCALEYELLIVHKKFTHVSYYADADGDGIWIFWFFVMMLAAILLYSYCVCVVTPSISNGRPVPKHQDIVYREIVYGARPPPPAYHEDVNRDTGCAENTASTSNRSTGMDTTGISTSSRWSTPIWEPDESLGRYNSAGNSCSPEKTASTSNRSTDTSIPKVPAAPDAVSLEKTSSTTNRSSSTNTSSIAATSNRTTETWQTDPVPCSVPGTGCSTIASTTNRFTGTSTRNRKTA